MTVNGVAQTTGAANGTQEKASKRAGGKVIEDLALWNHAARIGGGVTPALISQITREADQGDTRRLIDLANECRQRDAHLHAVLSTREESTAGLEWQIVAPEKSNKKSKTAAAWVEKTLHTVPALRRLIADLAGAAFYSFTHSEIIWMKGEKGRLVPADFQLIAHRRFKFRRQDGRQVFYDDGSPELDFRAKYPNKFISSYPRVTGDVPTREGLMRVLVWMSVMRNWSIADWLKTGEFSWKPWRIGTFSKEKSSAEDREELETIMRRMVTDFAAVIPDSTTIKVEWPGGTATRNSPHAEMVRALADEMSKAVLGQTETTQSSSSSGYAQAKVHENVRRDLLEAAAKQIASDITRDLIGPMIALNFGESVATPRFEFLTQDPVDLESFSKSIAALRTAGARIPEAWFHETAGIPIPDEGETLVGEAADKAAAEAAAAKAKKPTDESTEEEPEVEEPDDEDEEQPETD